MTDTINVPRPLLERCRKSIHAFREAKLYSDICALLQAPAQPAQDEYEKSRMKTLAGYSNTLTTPKKPPVQVQGWKLVPVKITPAMENADPYGMGYGRLHAIWSSLLAAAPKPPVQEPVRQVIPCKTCGNGGSLEGDKECPVCWGVGYLGIAAPQPSDDVAKDAARYRWLRERGDACQWENILHFDLDEFVCADNALDAAIDAAMAGGGV